MASNRALTITGILVVAFLAQLAGHMLLKRYMPNVAVGGIGFLLVALIFSYVLFIRRDAFGFLLVVYICSHFSFADNQGGLWNLMTFGVMAIYIGLNQRRKEFPHGDSLMFALLGIFIFWNILGWVMHNPTPLIPKLQGIAAFFGFIFMFYLASNVVITKERFRLFLTVTFLMVLYQFIVALNQRYHLVDWNTPFIGGYTEFVNSIDRGKKYAPTSGTLRHFELFGEYGVLMICLFIPLLSSSLTQKELRFGINRIVIIILVCLSFPILTSNRAAAILSALVFFFYYLVLPMRIFSSIDRFSRQIVIIAMFAFLLPIAGTYIGLTQLEEDFSLLSSAKFDTADIVSGKSINRGGLVSAGLQRIYSDSWWVGNGYGVLRSNRWAWFGIDPEKQEVGFADFHSLYLSLPMLYGWIGSLAFLSMVVITWYRVFAASLKYRNRKSFLIVLSVGFTMFFGVFLIDQYKISILRNPNYQMMFWIWMGLANSVVKSIRYEKQGESVPVSSSVTVPNKVRTVGAP
jgi:hypothetical protein